MLALWSYVKTLAESSKFQVEPSYEYCNTYSVAPVEVAQLTVIWCAVPLAGAPITAVQVAGAAGVWPYIRLVVDTSRVISNNLVFNIMSF